MDDATGKDNLALLRPYFVLADTIAQLIGSHCEVAIHSVVNKNMSVVKIVNGHHTSRDIGSPMTDVGLKALKECLNSSKNHTHIYFTKNKDGQLLKSSTCVIRCPSGTPIGLLCVNINLSIPFQDIISTFMPQLSEHSFIHESFSGDARSMVIEAVARAKDIIGNDQRITHKQKNKEIVYRLFDDGIFEFKDSALIVGESLNITKFAVYKYLRELRNNNDEGGSHERGH